MPSTICKQIMAELKKLGNPQTKKTYMRHGAPEPVFGVKMGDLKPIQKRIKKDYELALELFDTGNSDAQYLAGLIADETKMTKRDLNRWVREASWYMISDFAVAWAASESPHAFDLALKWIESKRERTASAGWCTLSSYLSITPDEEIDMEAIEDLLARVVDEIHEERNEVRHVMNGFVIATGSFVKPLKAEALNVAEKIGVVQVDHGDTACKTPLASEYIKKVAKMGRTGKKRKAARC
ncbi:DNA alkylation repair protein [Haloferula sp.]|uniref:DNA alkylation repair protein n=1 Tax=Haloferula sp. TaxID=2497595 RepID=UPI00329A8770